MSLENHYLKISVMIAMIMFVIIALNFGNYSFWYDEYCTISFIKDGRSLSSLINIFITDEVSNPPVYTLFMYFWYRLFPHTQSCLLFPNVVFYYLGVFSLAYNLFKDTGEKISILICSIFCLVNSFAVKYEIYELRSYAMLFMFSSFVLLEYNAYRKEKNRKNMILLSVLMVLCSMTHYFGLLAISGFGVFDLIKVLKIRKKECLRNIFIYIPTLIIAGGWLIICMIHK
nr:glycosyltransferase family 39 protein [Lachnospiraceae bacterium]